MKVKATKVIDLDKFFNVEFNKKYPIISSACAILGIVAGVILQAINNSLESNIEEIFTEFYSINSSRSVPEIFLSSFAENIVLIAILMFFGFSCVGFAFVYVMPLFKGLGIGAVCSYIYSAYLFKGVAYCSLFVFPVAVIQLFAIVLACNESVQMSQDILQLIRKNGNTETRIRTDLYVLRYAVITFMIAFSSIIYSIGVLIFFRFL